MTKNQFNNDRVLEALKLQPISSEEMSKRHILGRLYGPIATFSDSTRNGRFYNKDLWTKALADDIFLEKVANKSLFLELEHPTDRDQIDMKQACACIPEVPKIVGDDLYAVIDILDTPNGRLLKTFVDYGFVPGISSRGSGDVDANNEVDPETFYLETWDIVSLPAVKKARLNVCESYNPNNKSLRHALKEALEKSSEEDKKIMQDTLNNMNIDVEEKLTKTVRKADGHYIDLDDVPELYDDADPNMLTEDVKDDAEPAEAEESEVIAIEADDVDSEDEPVEEEAEESQEVEETESSELTVNDVLTRFQDLDREAIVEIAPIEIEGISYQPTIDTIDQDEENHKIILGVECVPTESTDNIDADNSNEEEGTEEVVDEAEEAVDDGDDEVVENFKDLVRQKDLLESEVKSLKNSQAVSDAKVKELEESLDKYKAAFARTSELAANAKKLKTINESLNTKLSNNTKEIAELRLRANKAATLNESVDKNAQRVKSLTEKLQTMQSEFTESKTKLEEQVAQSNKKLQERTALAKQYKQSYVAVLERYIVSKAKLLGVRPVEITNKLDESYNIDDIDAVCDQILTESVSVNRLPFGNSRKATVKINESKQVNKSATNDSEDGFDLDSLISFAGLQ